MTERAGARAGWMAKEKKKMAEAKARDAAAKAEAKKADAVFGKKGEAPKKEEL